MRVATLAEQLNTAAARYRVGSLQQFRAKLHKVQPRTKKIFHAQTIMETYAFHDGGRTELQFNIGVEWRKGKPWWRHGVAFSFGRGITLPDPVGTLGPKVKRFNSWVGTSGDLLDCFKMWHWAGERSPDSQPKEISDALLEAEAFVFLGAIVPEAKVDVDRILQDFDVLYPLYQFVESETELKAPSAKLPEEVEKDSYIEGSVQKVLVNRYERDPKARDACVQHYGTTCFVCGFDFVATYGPVMKDFIHVHHLKQLSKLGPHYKVDPIKDLRPVCPNCHAVAHHRSEPYSLDEVRKFLESQTVDGK